MNKTFVKIIFVILIIAFILGMTIPFALMMGK
jgi:Tfp pilus assembly protein PilO